MATLLGLVLIGLFIWLIVWGISALFASGSSSSGSSYSGTISQIDYEARDAMRKASDQYKSDVDQATRS